MTETLGVLLGITVLVLIYFVRQYSILVGEKEGWQAKAYAEARISLEKWKVENEAAFRQDAIVRSKAVTLGKVTEHLMPYVSIFPYNPKDVRFVGSPIDLLVFDGLDEDALQQVIFLEVKTGRSKLSQRQKAVKEAVLAHRVVWRELNIDREQPSAGKNEGVS